MMRDSKSSIFVFACYLAVMSGVLIIYPTLFLYLGFGSVPLPWVSIAGYLVGVIAFLYFMAARAGNREFYRWSVIGRSPLIVFSSILVLLDMAPPILILLGVVDAFGAVWTAWAMRCENKWGQMKHFWK